MAVELQERPGRTSRWSTLFHKSKPSRDNAKVAEVLKDVKGGLAEEPREKGVAGAGEAEERDPIQHVAGTGIVVNEAQQPASPRPESTNNLKKTQVAFEADGGGSGAASVRRDSDPEIRLAGEGEDKDGRSAERSSEEEDGFEVARIEFYRKDQANFWLSNSSDHVVYLDGVRYPTAEHLFQALKFLPHRPDIATKVRKTSSPLDAMREARKSMADVKKGWIGQGGNVAAMREVLLLKFSQHSSLRRHLLLTGDSELVEASPTDAFWGNAAGANGGRIGLGRNELGKALTRTRETIRNQSGLGVGSGAKTV